MWIFDRNVSYGGRKPHLFLPLLLSTTSDQNVNLSKYKRLECEFLCCYKLMLRLHRVVVCKVSLGFT